jgi:hypothetical protein
MVGTPGTGWATDAAGHEANPEVQKARQTLSKGLMGSMVIRFTDGGTNHRPETDGRRARQARG